MNIYDICRASLAEHGSGRIHAVRVAVGELTAVEPDLLRFAWQAVTEATPDAGAKLTIDWRPAQQICSACGRDVGRVEGTWLRLCPECGGVLRVEGGEELDIIDLQVELDAPQEVTNAEGGSDGRADRRT